MSEQQITERPTPFSITWNWTFCTEECGWESAAYVDPAAAKAEGDTHALEEHGIPLPPPKGGWRAECDVEQCNWISWSYQDEARVLEAKGAHDAEHERLWAAGIGAHRGHRLLDIDGGMAECSCRKWVPAS